MLPAIGSPRMMTGVKITVQTSPGQRIIQEMPTSRCVDITAVIMANSNLLTDIPVLLEVVRPLPVIGMVLLLLQPQTPGIILEALPSLLTAMIVKFTN